MTTGPHHPDLSSLFCERVSDYLLYFVPVEVALEIAATRDALAQATRWGDVKRTLSRTRLAELVEWMVGGEEPPDDDEAFEAPESWPALSYHQIPGWLPDDIANQFGRPYSNMVDSGINFEVDDEEALVEALEAAGVTVRFDGPDLEELFTEPS